MLGHPEAPAFFHPLSCFACSDLLQVDRAAETLFSFIPEISLHIIVLPLPLQNACLIQPPGALPPLSPPFSPPQCLNCKFLYFFLDMKNEILLLKEHVNQATKDWGQKVSHFRGFFCRRPKPRRFDVLQSRTLRGFFLPKKTKKRRNTMG